MSISAHIPPVIKKIVRSISMGTYAPIRRRTPIRGHYVLGGVPVLERRMLDDVVPRFALPRPVESVKHITDVSVTENWESGLVEGIHALVHAGDRVVIVGGGWGVTAVLHGRAVGKHGQVTVFEGSLPYVEQVKETLRVSGSTNVQVVHAVVGAAVDVWDNESLPEVVSEVPACDVLELDCEGAELQILSTLGHRPRAIVVETHGYLGAPSDEVEALLRGLGYNIRSAVPSDKSESSRERDCLVLQALHRGRADDDLPAAQPP